MSDKLMLVTTALVHDIVTGPMASYVGLICFRAYWAGPYPFGVLNLGTYQAQAFRGVHFIFWGA